MNTELFIARKIISGGKREKKISRPIIRIAIIGITLGIAVMILAMAIVTGFQNEIRDKVIGFGSHIQIKGFTSNLSYESEPMLLDQDFYPDMEEESGVSNIQMYAIKPGIIQSKGDTVEIAQEEVEVRRDIKGVIVKGIGPDFDWSFFAKHIVKGNPFYVSDTAISDSIVLSKHIADKLKLELHDKVPVYFVQDKGPRARNFVISGIYETGLYEFDRDFIFADIQHIRNLNNWGVNVNMLVKEQCSSGSLVVEALATGGNNFFKYNWGDGHFVPKDKLLICPQNDTIIQVVASDFTQTNLLSEQEILSIPDTAWLKVVFEKKPEGCNCTALQSESIDEYTRRYWNKNMSFTTHLTTSGGSGKYYVGGFEVTLDDYKELQNMDEIIRKNIDPRLETSTITENYQEIFSWLEMLDINVIIIVILMIVVAVINMSSALLVLILERTSMIGILKAIGAPNWSIRKVFLYNAAYLIGKGLFYGNLLGIGIALLQQYTGIFKLPQENYYVSEVPVELHLSHLLTLNAGTLLICIFVLILPSYLVTNIKPVKAIRFN